MNIVFTVTPAADLDAGTLAGEAATAAAECPECLGGNLNWLLAQAHYALGGELAAAFEPLGFSPRGHAVLKAAGTGSHTQKRLAEMVGLDKTTMVATIDELEEKGLASRAPSPTDRRAHVVSVTREGAKAARSADKIVARVQADVLGSLGEPGGADLLAALGRLVAQRLSEPMACSGIRRREPRPRAGT